MYPILRGTSSLQFHMQGKGVFFFSCRLLFHANTSQPTKVQSASQPGQSIALTRRLLPVACILDPDDWLDFTKNFFDAFDTISVIVRQRFDEQSKGSPTKNDWLAPRQKNTIPPQFLLFLTIDSQPEQVAVLQLANPNSRTLLALLAAVAM